MSFNLQKGKLIYMELEFSNWPDLVSGKTQIGTQAILMYTITQPSFVYVLIVFGNNLSLSLKPERDKFYFFSLQKTKSYLLSLR